MKLTAAYLAGGFTVTAVVLAAAYALVWWLDAQPDGPPVSWPSWPWGEAR